jgi:hypothetical protein
MSSKEPAPSSSNQGCFDNFIKLVVALGGGAGIVAVLTFLLNRPPTPTPTTNVTGTWHRSDGTTAVFSQIGDTVHCQGFDQFRNLVAECKEGKIIGQKISYRYTLKDSLTGQVVEGEAELDIVSNGQQMSGTWKNNLGRSGDIVLSR